MTDTPTTDTDTTIEAAVISGALASFAPASSHMAGAVQLAEWSYDRATELAEACQISINELGAKDAHDVPEALLIIDKDGGHRIIDLADRRARPASIRAHRTLDDPNAFAHYIDRFSTPATTLWAQGDSVTAILDDHEGAGSAANPAGFDVVTRGRPSWGRHRATLKLTVAPEWKGWASLHRVFVAQEAFAEIIEEFASTMLDPDAELMLQVAQSITVTSTGQVSSSVSLRDGALNLNVTEQLEANAGTRDVPLQIPARLKFLARRWLGVPPTELTARLRYRVNRGKLTLGLVIDRLEDVEDQYRRNLVESLRSATGCPVFFGSPGSQ